jgi:hypothetical protein
MGKLVLFLTIFEPKANDMVSCFVELTLVDNSTKCKSKLDVELMSVSSGNISLLQSLLMLQVGLLSFDLLFYQAGQIKNRFILTMTAWFILKSQCCCGGSKADTWNCFKVVILWII